MAQTKIKLNAVEDATELVQAAEKCDFDIMWQMAGLL